MQNAQEMIAEPLTVEEVQALENALAETGDELGVQLRHQIIFAKIYKLINMDLHADGLAENVETYLSQGVPVADVDAV